VIKQGMLSASKGKTWGEGRGTGFGVPYEAAIPTPLPRSIIGEAIILRLFTNYYHCYTTIPTLQKEADRGCTVIFFPCLT